MPCSFFFLVFGREIGTEDSDRCYLLQQLWLPSKTGGGRCTLSP